MGKNKKAEIEFKLSKKDQKKVDKLEAQIPYYEARRETDQVDKIKSQVEAITEKAKAKFEADLMK